MTERELMKNASAVKDETAFKALKNTIGAGEIYSCKEGRYLVLNDSQNGRNCPVLKVLVKEPEEANAFIWAHISVGDDQEYYADTSMPAYKGISNLQKGRLLGIVDDEKMTFVKDCVADALGIRVKIEQPVKSQTVSDGIYKKLYNELLDKLVNRL